MAIVVDARTGHPLTLPAHCLFGRSSACSPRIEDPRVSGEHARITWLGEAWELKDLGSRNGTFLNGHKLDRGGAALLSVSDRIALGDDSISFSVLDLSPPVAQARSLSSSRILQASSAVLALPSPDSPDVSIFEDADGQWRLEHDGDVEITSDGAVIDVAGEAFMLHLPAPVTPTIDASFGPPDVRSLALGFRVSLDEERVEVTALIRGDRHVIPPRAHHYTWLTLARRMQEDTTQAKLPDASRGWLSIPDLCRMLAIDENKLNVDFFRIRQDVGSLGLQTPASIIERRRGSRQARLGTSQLTIDVLS
ncbi:MAG: FHA domain-containing protein [Polyangiaceae bacterium]